MDPIFERLLQLVTQIDTSTPNEAEAALTRAFPPDGAEALSMKERLRSLVNEGVLANRGELPVRYSRVTKATVESFGFSIDVVHMTGPGPLHSHPRGEIDLCFALSGAPTFDGRGPGWVVYPPNSKHVPTVAGGEMVIVYFLPEGAIEFAAV